VEVSFVGRLAFVVFFLRCLYVGLPSKRENILKNGKLLRADFCADSSSAGSGLTVPSVPFVYTCSARRLRMSAGETTEMLRPVLEAVETMLEAAPTR